jgi:hypothetical protein
LGTAAYPEAGVNPEVAKLKELFAKAMFDQVVIKGVETLDKGTLAREDSLSVVRLLAISAAHDRKPELSETYLLKLIDMDYCTDFSDSEMSPKFRKVWFKVLRDTKFVPCEKRELLTVAVVEFKNGSFVDADKLESMGKGIASLIRYNLESSGVVYVPSREHINELVGELKLSKTDLVDQELKLEAGKVVGAKNFVFGTFIKKNKDDFQILARVVETETTLPKESFSVEGKNDKIEEVVFDLAKQIMEYFKVEKAKIEEASAKIPDIDLAALNQFSLGITYEEMGDYKLAEQAYAAAMEIAPSFTLAGSHRERVQLELKSLGQ